MKRFFTLLVQGIFLSCICSCDDDTAGSSQKDGFSLTETEKELVHALNAEIHPIVPQPLQIPDDQLTSLDRLANIKIVGLGEASYGTKEFIQMKHRAFQYLVKNHGFSAFLLDIDFAEALIFDNWIQGNDDTDLVTLMKNDLLYWNFTTTEVQKLFTWMRDHNEHRTNNKIHLFGIDARTPTYDLDALTDRLETLDPILATDVLNFNQQYKKIWNLYAEKDHSVVDTIEEGIEKTISLIQREKEHLINLSSPQEFMWIERLARHMEQVENFNYAYHFEKKFHLSDLYMAENTLWLGELLGNEAKLVLWAHNWHIGRNQMFSSSSSAGNHLHLALGDNYQAIGFSFGKGTFTAKTEIGIGVARISSSPVRNSYNFIFSQTESPAFILDLSQVQNLQLKEWTQSGQNFFNAGTQKRSSPSLYYDWTPLADHYDFIIHFNESSHSNLLYGDVI